jgi:hypothetical protein
VTLALHNRRVSTSAERMRRLRERRAAGLLPADGEPPRPADELLAPAVAETFAALELGEGDQAAALLARRYAAVIDQAQNPAYALRWLGPLLLASLESLQATPMSRRAVRPVDRQPSQLDRLRVVHASGKRLEGL